VKREKRERKGERLGIGEERQKLMESARKEEMR
jgi:hypothetical protein